MVLPRGRTNGRSVRGLSVMARQTRDNETMRSWNVAVSRIFGSRLSRDRV